MSHKEPPALESGLLTTGPPGKSQKTQRIVREAISECSCSDWSPVFPLEMLLLFLLKSRDYMLPVLDKKNFQTASRISSRKCPQGGDW